MLPERVLAIRRGHPIHTLGRQARGQQHQQEQRRGEKTSPEGLPHDGRIIAHWRPGGKPKLCFTVLCCALWCLIAQCSTLAKMSNVIASTARQSHGAALRLLRPAGSQRQWLPKAGLAMTSLKASPEH